MTQGEGGEQGRRIDAVVVPQRSFREGEVLFTFLDDVFSVSMPVPIFSEAWILDLFGAHC